MWQRGVSVLRRVWGDWRGQMYPGKRAGQLSGRLREGGRRGWRESGLREGGHSASVHRVTLKSAPSLGVEGGFSGDHKAGRLSGSMAGELPVPEQPSARGGSWGRGGGEPCTMCNEKS